MTSPSSLRKTGRVVLVVANKVDSAAQEAAAWELARAGTRRPVPISGPARARRRGPARPRRGTVSCSDAGRRSRARVGSPAKRRGHGLIRRGQCGRLGDDRRAAERRQVDAVQPPGRRRAGRRPRRAGHTSDAIDTVVETDEGRIRFIDTAGLRRKSRIDEGTEYFSLVRSLAASTAADLALLVIDATSGVTHQDQRLAERIDAAGNPIVLVLNKWDLLSTEQRLVVAADVADRLGFLAYAAGSAALRPHRTGGAPAPPGAAQRDRRLPPADPDAGPQPRRCGRSSRRRRPPDRGSSTPCRGRSTRRP